MGEGAGGGRFLRVFEGQEGFWEGLRSSRVFEDQEDFQEGLRPLRVRRVF